MDEGGRRRYAHSANAVGKWHPLADHLTAVAELAADFAEAFGAADEARLAGLLHDVGKYGEMFQKRLRGQARGVDHWSPGAWLALERYRTDGIAAAVAVRGHHVGLQQSHKDALRELLPARLAQSTAERGLSFAAPEEVAEGLDADAVVLPGATPTAYSGLRGPHASAMLDVRMLFSTLVDADYLDTEAHFAASDPRPPGLDLEPERALAALDRYLDALAGAADATRPVHALRQELLGDCRAAALGPTGAYTLTAPTGTGKTLAMLAFALTHAARHGLRRIVCVLPYLSIIEQTARVYREALAEATPQDRADEYVLEDHSLAHQRPADDDGDDCHKRGRLLAENWDAPIVVTTSVQCLESLFANRPARCRKLHRLARSVLLFDEAQTLRTELAVPTLATLSGLAERFGSTVVFATATQPAFEGFDAAIRNGLAAKGWAPPEIVRDPPRLFRRAHRTRLRWIDADWEELAAELAGRTQVLCIVNLKRHALGLIVRLRELGVDGLCHLSTSMCPAHRAIALSDVRARLAEGRACRLVATQCVEAGVDLDFPEVFRAHGPLDAIAQAAGRCNREARREEGLVTVFRTPAEAHPYPDRAYGQAADVTAGLLTELGPAGLSLDDPAVFRRYYRDLYDIRGVGATDSPLLQAVRIQHFADVAKAFRVIEKDAVNVLVPYAKAEFEALASEARQSGLTRDWVARARPHTIGMYRTSARDTLLEPVPLAARRGEFAPDWLIYAGPQSDYDELLGLAPSGLGHCIIA